MAPSLPTNFNNTDDFINYGKDLGITVGLGFVIPAIVLSLIQIIIFVVICCGKVEKKDVFTTKARAILIACSIAITAIAVGTCITGWSYNQETHSQVESASTTLQAVITSTSNVMSAVNDTTNSFKSELFQGIDAAFSVVSNISNLLVPIDNVFDVIWSIDGAVHNLTILTQSVASNLTAVRNDLNNLYLEETSGVISGVPSPTDIPNVGDQTVAALNEATYNLNSVSTSVTIFSTSINNTITDVSSVLGSDLMGTINSYYQKVDDAVFYFNEFNDKIRKTNDSYNDISSSIVHYSSIRMSIVAGILVLPILLSSFSLVGVFFRMKLLLKITSAFCFIFMFWYFLVAGLNYAAYYTTDSFCQNQDTIISNLISISKSDITVPGTNITESVPDKVRLLLKCSGNTTLIDIFNFGFFIDDLDNTIQAELDKVNEQTQQLNQTETYITSLEELTNVENNSVNLDYLQNSNLTLVHTRLDNITTQLNNIINNPAYNQSLQDVNAITNNLLLTNGTTIHNYYDASNITRVNCTTDPYDKLDQPTQQDLCEKAGTAIGLTIVRNRAILKAQPINGNITDINSRLYGFEESLPTVYYYQGQTFVWANIIRTNLRDAFNGALRIIFDLEGIINAMGNMIVAQVRELGSRTQCAFVGQAYSDLTSNLCSKIRVDLQVIAAMMVLGGLVFFSATLVSMFTLRKIEKDYYSEVM